MLARALTSSRECQPLPPLLHDLDGAAGLRVAGTRCIGRAIRDGAPLNPAALSGALDGSGVAAAAATACFSACGNYRWWLERCWEPQLPRLLFIGLNPSRADAERDDPTLRRLQAFARAWGYGGLEVLNLFGRVAVSPADLRCCEDPVGPDNNDWLKQRLRRLLWRPEGGDLWLGWGNGGTWRGRDREVLDGLTAQLTSALPLEPARLPKLLTIGLTASGQPRHPLYVSGCAKPQLLLHSGEALSLTAFHEWPESPVVTPSVSS